MTENEQYVYMVYRRDFRIYKRLRLCNRHIQVDNDIVDEFIRIVEMYILVNKCKVYDPVKTIYLENSIRWSNNMRLSNRSTK